jgi:hypothetical protein
MLRAEWAMVGITLLYTVSTILLWWTTKRSLDVTTRLLQLDLLSEYFRTQEPAPNVGHPWETREVPVKIEQLRAKQADLMRRAFPELRGLIPEVKEP